MYGVCYGPRVLRRRRQQQQQRPTDSRPSPVVRETRNGNNRAIVPGLADDDDDDDGGDFSFHLAIPDRPHVRGLRLSKHHHMGIANGGSDGAVPYLPSVSSRRGARDDEFSSIISSVASCDSKLLPSVLLRAHIS